MIDLLFQHVQWTGANINLISGFKLITVRSSIHAVSGPHHFSPSSRFGVRTTAESLAFVTEEPSLVRSIRAHSSMCLLRDILVINDFPKGPSSTPLELSPYIVSNEFWR